MSQKRIDVQVFKTTFSLEVEESFGLLNRTVLRRGGCIQAREF